MTDHCKVEVTITMTDNGYIVNDGETVTVHGGNEVSMVDALAEALWMAKDGLEWQGSSYSDKRVYIIVHPGDHHDGYDEGFDKFRE